MINRVYTAHSLVDFFHFSMPSHRCDCQLRNDWIPYQYDSPLHLVSECDGCRVMGTHKIEFVQRVPQSVESIFSIGSYDPPALLLFALEKYEKGDVCAQDRASLIT